MWITFWFWGRNKPKKINNQSKAEKFLELWKIKIHASIINEKKDYETKIKELKEFDYLKKIDEKPILEYLQISSLILDPKGDRYQNYSQNEIRGGEAYIPQMIGMG